MRHRNSRKATACAVRGCSAQDHTPLAELCRSWWDQWYNDVWQHEPSLQTQQRPDGGRPVFVFIPKPSRMTEMQGRHHSLCLHFCIGDSPESSIAVPLGRLALSYRILRRGVASPQQAVWQRGCRLHSIAHLLWSSLLWFRVRLLTGGLLRLWSRSPCGSWSLSPEVLLMGGFGCGWRAHCRRDAPLHLSYLSLGPRCEPKSLLEETLVSAGAPPRGRSARRASSSNQRT